MKLKKIYLGLLTIFTICMLVACGGNTNSGGKSDSAKVLASKGRVKSGTIEVYVPKGKNTDYLIQSLKIYNKKYDTNLKLKPVDVSPVEMVQKITPKLIANEKMPELTFLADSNASAILGKFESRFYSAENYGFIKKYGNDFYSVPINLLKNASPSKKVFGFPNDWGTAVMFYNDSAFKEAGVDMTTVKSWDEFIAAGKKLKAKTGKNLLFMRDTGELDLVKYIAESQGMTEFDKDGNLNILNDKMYKAYDIIKKLTDAHLVSYGNAKDYSSIGQECGAMFAGGWLASYQMQEYPNDSGKWRIAKMPSVGEGKIYSPVSGGSSYYVSKKSDNGLAALQFISFALTDKDCLDTYMDLSGLPANKTAYKSAKAQKEFKYYGGQKILPVLDKITQNSVTGYSFPYTADLDNYIEAASYDIQKNGVPVKQALKKKANDFVSKYNIKLVK